MIELYQHLPQLISPIAFSIGHFYVRWYSISYIVGFLAAYFVLMRSLGSSDPKEDVQISNFQFPISNKNPKIPNTKYQIRNTVLDFLLVNFFAALVGGRIGYVLFYDFSYFIPHLLSIISPYSSGKFIGFYGMSYHGALLAVILASYLFLRLKRINFWVWADFVAPAAALGYFFGRIGNFLNGELYGRVTDSRWGMYFTADPAFLRHPSQLYEAFLEGLLLFLFLKYFEKKKTFRGQVFCLYLLGYAIARTAAENFRQPDDQIGFVFAGVTLGQILSLAMFAVGALMYSKLRNKKK